MDKSRTRSWFYRSSGSGPIKSGGRIKQKNLFIFYKNGWKPIAEDLVWHEQIDRTITVLRQQITLEQRADIITK